MRQVGPSLMQVCSDQNAASTWREEGGFPVLSPSSAAHTVVGGAAFVLGGWDLEHKVEVVDQYIMYHEGASSHGVWQCGDNDNNDYDDYGDYANM